MVLSAHHTWHIHSVHTPCPLSSSFPPHPLESFPYLPRIWLNALVPRQCSVNMEKEGRTQGEKEKAWREGEAQRKAVCGWSGGELTEELGEAS